jgi:hypothetical protein
MHELSTSADHTSLFEWAGLPDSQPRLSDTLKAMLGCLRSLPLQHFGLCVFVSDMPCRAFF